MTDPSDTPEGVPANLWGMVFTPRPKLDDGLLSTEPKPAEEKEELDPYLDAYYGEVDW